MSRKAMSRKAKKRRNRNKPQKPSPQTAYEVHARLIPQVPTPEPSHKRPPRVFVPDGVYHVRCYGNNHTPLFLDNHDHAEFDRLLEEGARDFGHEILSFKKMPHHVHLVIQVAQVSLSVIMHSLCRRYAFWFNRTHGRTGHLFGRRFADILVDAKRYLLGLVAFVHRHGVRSGLVATPEDDELSSYPAYLDPEKARATPWLSTRKVLDRLKAERQGLRESTAKVDPNVPYTRGVDEDRRFLGDQVFIRQSLADAKPLR